MNLWIYYFLPIIICIIASAITIIIGKHIHKPVYWIVVVLVISIGFIQYISLENIIFDSDGNKYDFSEWEDEGYKKATYYNKEGEQFYIRKDKVINVKNPSEEFDVTKTYLNKDGRLIFDTKNEYKNTWQTGIFASNNQEHVYDLSLGSWDVFGHFVLPEAKGIVKKGIYFSLCLLKDENAKEDIASLPLTNSLYTVFMYISDIFIVMQIIYIFFIVKTIIKREEEVPIDTQYKVTKYGFICLEIKIYCLSIINSKSYFTCICCWIFHLLMVYVLIPFIQGYMQIGYDSKDDSEKCSMIFLKDMLNARNKLEVHKWRVLLCSILSVQFICWIGISIVYSIQSSLYC